MDVRNDAIAILYVLLEHGDLFVCSPRVPECKAKQSEWKRTKCAKVRKDASGKPQMTNETCQKYDVSKQSNTKNGVSLTNVLDAGVQRAVHPLGD